MADTNGEECSKELFNPVLSMGAQVSAILVLSHFFQILLKPLGQAAPVAQILAGFVLGPSGLSRIDTVNKFFLQSFATDYYETMALYCRIIIMYLMGLELDFPYLMRNVRPASIIACSNCFMCTLFAVAITSFVHTETKEKGFSGHAVMIALVISVVLANTAAPFVVRVAADLKFATSELGRLAISSSLISDVYAVFLLIIVTRFNKADQTTVGIFLSTCFYLIIVVGVIVLNMYFVNWLNRRNRNHKYLKNPEMFGLLAIVFVCAMILETFGYSSIVACFLLGSMFPRRGKAARTLMIKLTYTVHNFILPIYFGYSGFKADITEINTIAKFAIVVIVLLLSIGGKIAGTLAACYHLKIPLTEGVLLSFLMNLKGHVDLLTLTVGMQNKTIFTLTFYKVMTTTVVINSLIWGPLVAYMVRRESDVFGYTRVPFESQNPESELRLLACVHGPRSVPTMIGLIAASRGSENVAITPYMMHLIELPEKTKNHLMYHQKEEDELSDDEDYGGNDVLEINEAVDIFTAETGVMIHQVKAVAPFASMYVDVCEFAEDIRASIIFLPFHKHQRIDGKLESGKEGIRTSNQKILRHAKCSGAILVDRGLSSGTSNAAGSESLQHVASLFFGGPDDREALGFSKRLGMHHHINMTVIRFLPASAKRNHVGVNIALQQEDVLMAISDRGTEHEKDNAVLTDFYNRYVTSGQVGYVEKLVHNGAETALALRDMADMYSLFIVGKGGRGNSLLASGLSDWEECPELGKVGDFLASAEFDMCGSVLVIQQHRHTEDDANDQ